MSDVIQLDDNQQLLILKEWNERKTNPPSLTELIKVAFNGDFDNRSPHGKAVRKFLASRKLVLPKEVSKTASIQLTEEQKEYIGNNCANMTSVEMARELFNNQILGPLNAETRIISTYIKTLPDIIRAVKDVPEIEEYKAPVQLVNAIARINKYIFEPMVLEKLGPSQKKNVQALMGYLHTFRFVTHINTYETKEDRELFESGFIRNCHDKADLTEEEVDQYIMYSSEVVIDKSILRRIEMFSKKLDDTMAEDGKLGIALVEAITSLRSEHNQCVDRQRKLLEALQGKRSERLKDRIKENASILNLVELWKFEKTRREMIEVAEKQKQLLKDEIDRLSTMDEIKSRVLGISTSEILNG